MENPGNVAETNWRRWAAIAAFLFVLFLLLFIFLKIIPEMTNTSTSSDVRGTVYDASTGQPLGEAIIMITGGTHEHPDIAAQSDEKGHFALPPLQVPGTYTIMIRHGNRSREISLEINSKQEDLRIAF